MSSDVFYRNKLLAPSSPHLFLGDKRENEKKTDLKKEKVLFFVFSKQVVHNYTDCLKTRNDLGCRADMGHFQSRLKSS